MNRFIACVGFLATAALPQVAPAQETASAERPAPLWVEQTVDLPKSQGMNNAVANFLIGPNGTVRDFSLVEGEGISATDGTAVAALRTSPNFGIRLLRCKAPAEPYCEIEAGKKVCVCIIDSGGGVIGDGNGPNAFILSVSTPVDSTGLITAGDVTVGLAPISEIGGVAVARITLTDDVLKSLELR